MTSTASAAILTAVLAIGSAAAQDTVFLIDGSKLDGVRVTGFDIRSLRYTKGGKAETVPSDQIARVELEKFRDVFRRGLRDPDLMLTIAREQLEQKNPLLAQLGFVGAAAQFFDSNRPAEGVAALDELAKGIPEAGVLPEVHRQKFEYYMGLGGKGASSAAQVAKKYESDAIGGAWPGGFAVEAEFFQVLSSRASAQEFQSKLRSLIGKARGSNATVANRANVQLANSLRESKDTDGARRIYEEILAKDSVDASSRAGALLGLGKILYEQGAAADDKNKLQQALLMFLRVRLETRDAWPSLHAEALYNAVLAAEKWRGPEYTLVMSRCRRTLFNEFRGSEWAELARAGR